MAFSCGRISYVFERVNAFGQTKYQGVFFGGNILPLKKNAFFLGKKSIFC